MIERISHAGKELAVIVNPVSRMGSNLFPHALFNSLGYMKRPDRLCHRGSYPSPSSK